METLMNFRTKHDRIIDEIQRRGLRLEEYPRSVRVVGSGVDIRASRLTYLNLDDLKPVRD